MTSPSGRRRRLSELMDEYAPAASSSNQGAAASPAAQNEATSGADEAASSTPAHIRDLPASRVVVYMRDEDTSSEGPGQLAVLERQILHGFRSAYTLDAVPPELIGGDFRDEDRLKPHKMDLHFGISRLVLYYALLVDGSVEEAQLELVLIRLTEFLSRRRFSVRAYEHLVHHYDHRLVSGMDIKLHMEKSFSNVKYNYEDHRMAALADREQNAYVGVNAAGAPSAAHEADVDDLNEGIISSGSSTGGSCASDDEDLTDAGKEAVPLRKVYGTLVDMHEELRDQQRDVRDLLKEVRALTTNMGALTTDMGYVKDKLRAEPEQLAAADAGGQAAGGQAAADDQQAEADAAARRVQQLAEIRARIPVTHKEGTTLNRQLKLLFREVDAELLMEEITSHMNLNSASCVGKILQALVIKDYWYEGECGRFWPIQCPKVGQLPVCAELVEFFDSLALTRLEGRRWYSYESCRQNIRTKTTKWRAAFRNAAKKEKEARDKAAKDAAEQLQELASQLTGPNPTTELPLSINLPGHTAVSSPTLPRSGSQESLSRSARKRARMRISSSSESDHGGGNN